MTTKVKTWRPRLGRFWRGVTGVLAAGLVLLGLAMIGMQVYAGGRGLPGPGTAVVTGHVVAAVVAGVGQWLADRRTRWWAVVGGAAVLLSGAATLWIYWWA